MAANEVSRLRSEHSRPRAEEGSVARPVLREPSEEAQSDAPEAGADNAHASGETLAALERAADNIRPSWHGAEIAPTPPKPPASEAATPAALPPPPALPSFSSFPIEHSGPHYRVDTTVRTAAVLPERLAQLLSQPQIADASHWLRARPWARGGLAAAVVLLLAWLFWPSAPEAPAKSATKPTPTASAPTLPAAPAPSAAPEPPPAAPSEAVAAQPEPEPPAIKKRDKRKAAVVKAAAAKTAAKALTSAPAAAKGAEGAAKPRKPAKTIAAPAR